METQHAVDVGMVAVADEAATFGIDTNRNGLFVVLGGLEGDHGVVSGVAVGLGFPLNKDSVAYRRQAVKGVVPHFSNFFARIVAAAFAQAGRIHPRCDSGSSVATTTLYALTA